MAAANNLINIGVLGDKKLQAKLSKLEKQVQRKIVRQAMRDAAKLVKAAGEARIAAISPGDEGTGALRREGLKIRAVKRTRKGRRIGVLVMTPTRSALGIPHDSPWYYPAILEFGDSRIQPARFLRGAKESSEAEALAVIKARIRSGVMAAVK